MRRPRASSLVRSDAATSERETREGAVALRSHRHLKASAATAFLRTPAFRSFGRRGRLAFRGQMPSAKPTRPAARSVSMDWSVLDPKGPVGVRELHFLANALWLMMAVAVPVIVLTLWFAWRYRASSQTARFTPDWDRS